eukprot:2506982-Prymnesium_polylepis.1
MSEHQNIDFMRHIQHPDALNCLDLENDMIEQAYLQLKHRGVQVLRAYGGRRAACQAKRAAQGAT